MLQRWVSADPLGVHVPGDADLNLYAYVRGQALKAIDPLGLQESITSPDRSQRMAVQESGSTNYVPETAVGSCNGGRSYCDAEGNVVGDTQAEAWRKQDEFTTNYAHAQGRDKQEKENARIRRNDPANGIVQSDKPLEPVDLPLPGGGAAGASKKMAKNIFGGGRPPVRAQVKPPPGTKPPGAGAKPSAWGYRKAPVQRVTEKQVRRAEAASETADRRVRTLTDDLNKARAEANRAYNELGPGGARDEMRRVQDLREQLKLAESEARTAQQYADELRRSLPRP
jgi:hypothetical protein